MTDIDVVTVFHREENYRQAQDLERSLKIHDRKDRHTFIGIDNREYNRGFAKGCNEGAWLGDSPVIAFLNPDVEIDGDIFTPVLDVFAADNRCVITGEKFGKHPREYQKHWGCDDWVCGAAFFVRRDFFRAMGGFDVNFVWGWEETDLIRRAQEQGYYAKSIWLPLRHSSPTENSPEDHIYKNHHFDRGARLFFRKWKVRPS